MKRYTTTVLAVFIVFLGHAIEAPAFNKSLSCFQKKEVPPSTFSGTSNLYFEKNLGQVLDENGIQKNNVHYTAKMNGFNIFFTTEGIVYHFKKTELSNIEKIRSGAIHNPYTNEEWEKIMLSIADNTYQGKENSSKTESYRIDLIFPGAKLNQPEGENILVEKHDYYSPKYPDGLKDVPLSNRIRYKNVYEGIDLVFYFESGNLKYDFELAPFANPSNIKVLYIGHQHINLDQKGNAVIKILPGEITEKAPVSFQNGKMIQSRFSITNDTISFSLGSDYDKSQPLRIDPELVWATYFENNYSSMTNYLSNVVWDSYDNMYMVGTISTNNFPVINPGGTTFYQGTNSGGNSIVIMKFNAVKQLVWCTYYKATQNTSCGYYGKAVGIDSKDNLYISAVVTVGYTSPYTTDLPLQNPGNGAYYQTASRGDVPFILKFNSTGERQWATLFGAPVDGTRTNNYSLNSLVVGANDKIYLAGTTYPHTGGTSWAKPPMLNPGGGGYFKDAPVESQVPVISRMSDIGVLEWSTYISQGVANSYNQGYDLAVDASGNVFFAGTASQVFGQSTATAYTIVNPGGGAYQDAGNTATNNGRKISIFKFSTASILTWSTLYGGNASANSVIWQDPYRCEVAPSGDFVIVGRVNTTNFPTYSTGSAYIKSTLSTGTSYVCDGIILQFSNAGVRKWATYYGANGTSEGTDLNGLGFDASSNMYVSGLSRTTSIPAVAKTGSYNQATQTGEYAMIFAQFSNAGVREWATYFGNNTWGGSQWRGAFGSKSKGCSFKFVQSGYAGLGPYPSSDHIYLPLTVNPGGGAYFLNTKSGSYSDFILEFTDQKIPSSVASDNDSKTCPCSGNSFTHFIPDGTQRGILSINPNGQNLGDVTATAYVSASPIVISNCNSASPSNQSHVLGRRYKVTPTNQPSTSVKVRLYFSQGEFDLLKTAANSNSNTFDDLSTIADLKVTRFHATSNLSYENGTFTDNCGNGTLSLHPQTSSSNATSLFSNFESTGRYVEFQTSQFSEFWLHGSSTNSALPVDLLYFSSSCENSEQVVRLQWETGSESNSDKFIIEKSMNLENWSSVSETTAAGNSTQNRKYISEDREIIFGTTYYRLIQKDFNGNEKIYGPISSMCEASGNSILAFPNPFNQEIHVNVVSMNDENATLILFDMQGKLVYQKNVNLFQGNNTFDINKNLEAGIYTLKISNTLSSFETIKLIKL